MIEEKPIAYREGSPCLECGMLEICPNMGAMCDKLEEFARPLFKQREQS